MLLHFTPRDWFFIFLGVMICCYIKAASAKSQTPIAPLFKLAKIGRLL
jgi:hypothetical protein